MELTSSIREEANLLAKKEQDQIHMNMKEIESIQRHRGLVLLGEELGGDNIANDMSKCREKQKVIETRLTEDHRDQHEIQCNLSELKQAERIAREKAEQVRKSKERIEAS